jgi:PAS domain S-box-containing protein
MGRNKKGVDRFSLFPDGRIKSVKNFSQTEGFEGFEANMRASYLADNQLYICTILGLFKLAVKNKTIDPQPFKPEITNVRISNSGGQWIDSLTQNKNVWFAGQNSGIVFDKNPKAISFSYNCINAIFGNKLLYSYQLDQGSWSEPVHEKQTILIGIEGGKHVFRVRTTYDKVQFSNASEFKFEISIPWYLNPWIIWISLLLFLFAFLLSGRWFLNLFKENQFNNSNLNIGERSGQIILFLFTLFYPITYYINSYFEKHIYFNSVNILIITVINLVFFVIRLLNFADKKRIQIFLIISFLIFIIDSSVSLVMSQMASYHVITLLYISSLAYLVFYRYWQIILFSIFINAFALWCHIYIENPFYNPIPFQMGTLGLSVILIIMHIARTSNEQKVKFAHQVVNTGPVLVLGFRFDGTLIFSSENVKKLLGFTPIEIEGRNWWSIVITKNEDMLAMLQRIIEHREKDFKIKLKTKQGDFRVYNFTGRAINKDVMVMLGQDITDSQLLETRFEHLVENAPDAIYQTDFYGKIIYANPQTSLLLGIPKENLIGKHFIENVKEEVRENVMAFYREQFSNRTPITYNEFPVVTRTGQIRWFGFQVSMLQSPDKNKIEGYLSIGRDITERIESEQLIQIQHKNITDSLNYASRIKQALLPTEGLLKKVFTHYAFYKKPKDIIGGDFFWIQQSSKKALFVMGDCTGHGVPGAFMTTIAVGLLRQIVKEDGYWNVEEILGLFNRAIVRLLGSNLGNEMPDFAELALLHIDFENGKMDFLSSGIGMYQAKADGTMIPHLNGSRGYNFKYDYKGQSQSIEIDPNDVFFIFTDGLFDQIGGTENKRLGRKRLLEWIAKSDQRDIKKGLGQIEKHLEQWQGMLPQIDDRMMLSFRF